MLLVQLVLLFVFISLGSSKYFSHTHKGEHHDIGQFHTCGDHHDILTLNHVSMSPNPPKKGGNVTISVSGNINETIMPGAKILVKVKWAHIKILEETYDFCEESKEFGVPCPIKAGPRTLKQEVEIPSIVPPGTYTIIAEVEQKCGRRVSCVKGKIKL